MQLRRRPGTYGRRRRSDLADLTSGSTVSSMRLASRPRPRHGLLAQRAADTVVLLDPESGEYYALGDIGARLWELCDGTRDLAAMVQILCAEYDGTPSVVEADVLEFFEDLGCARLVVDAH